MMRMNSLMKQEKTQTQRTNMVTKRGSVGRARIQLESGFAGTHHFM